MKGNFGDGSVPSGKGRLQSSGNKILQNFLNYNVQDLLDDIK